MLMLQGRYELPLVLVSVLVAVFASYTALSLAGRVAHSRGRAAHWWIAGGALAMGTGIWSMHFIGMLAFRLPIPLGYDLGITLLSWAVPIAASALALAQIARKRVTPTQLAYSAVLIGIGINAMHYIGMAAMRMQPGIVWNPWLVALSMAIAVGASGASFWVAARLRSHTRGGWLLRGGAALCMGLAIVGMHYTGMAAAGFPAGSVCLSADSAFSLTELAVLVIVATVGILAIALITSVYDQRLAARTQVLTLSMRTATERQELLERERAARAEAERLGALKDQFLATLSHELRTPLNAILGWVQLLHHRKDEATLQRGLQTIERNARLQAKLIEDLLDISRIVAGKGGPCAAGRRGHRNRAARSRRQGHRTRRPPGPPRRQGLGRCRAAAAGLVEPAVQRHQVHRRGRSGVGHARTQPPRRHGAGQRQRQRHRAGFPAPRIRPFPPG
jgi:NO-binding membrane sensor protein with MHYT domain